MPRGSDYLRALYARSGSAISVIKDGWDIIPHRPQPKQQAFLDLDCLEALFGGAGGGGKTDVLLMDGFRFAHVPGYSALYLRRKLSDAALAGAIMDRAVEWFPRKYWNESKSRFQFPTPGGGYSQVQFGYMRSDIDRFRYASSEFDRIYFDELTHFSDIMYTFLFSRLRRKRGALVPLAMRGATNPGGPGERFVHDRFLNPETKKSYSVFIPSFIEDNAFIDAEEYEKTLEHADERTYMQIRHGKWLVPSSGRMFPLEESDIIEDAPKDVYHDDGVRVLGIDLGARQDVPTTAFTVCATSPYADNIYVLRSFKRTKMATDDMAALIFELMDEFQITEIRIDEGALGSLITEDLQFRHGIYALAAKKSDKLGIRKVLIGKMQKHKVKVVRGKCDDLVTELDSLVWNEQGTDNAKGAINHAADSFIYAARSLLPELAVDKKPVYARGSAQDRAQAEQEILDRDEANLERERRSAYDVDDDWDDGSGYGIEQF